MPPYAGLVKAFSTGYTVQSSNPTTHEIVGLDDSKLYRYTCSVHAPTTGTKTVIEAKAEMVAKFDTPEVGKLGFAHASDRLKAFAQKLEGNLGESLKPISS